jgi:hypothetical protein
MANRIKQDFKFAFAGITTEQFALEPSNYNAQNKVDLTLNLNFKHTEKESMLGVFVTVNLKQEQNQLVLLQVGCHFKIHLDTWQQIIVQENNSLRLPLNFALHLATLATGTIRGVLHARLANSPFAHYVLPAINLTEILKEDIILRPATKS